MEVDWGVVATIASPVIALFAGAIINRALESRPRLVTYLSHVSAHALKQDDGSTSEVFTHSVVLSNSGRRPANNVRLAHLYLPNFNVLPDIEHRIEEVDSGYVQREFRP